MCKAKTNNTKQPNGSWAGPLYLNLNKHRQKMQASVPKNENNPQKPKILKGEGLLLLF